MSATIIAIGPYDAGDVAPMEALGETRWVRGLDEVASADRETAKVLAYKFHAGIGGADMDALPALGLIANYGVGYDAIDTEAAQARDIAVTNTPSVLDDDVADLAVTMMFALSREIVAGHHHVVSGTWGREGSMPLNRKVSGARAGILGLGRIGRAIADRLAAFGMELHYFSRSEKETPGWTYHPDPVSLAGAVDYLIVATVGGDETRNIVDDEVLVALGDDGVLVNISRGSTVDEAALLDALEAGRIRGAALDVFENEPDPDPRFRSLGNVLLQPHQGSATVETRAAMGRLQRENIAAFLSGEALPTRVA